MTAYRVVAATRDGVAVARQSEGWRAQTALAGENVRSLAADPSGADRLWAGTQGAGVHRSDDGGATWRNAGLDGEIVKALAVDAGGRVFAATKPPALFVSRSGEGDWEELPALRAMRRPYWWQPAERPHTPYVSALAVSPADPATILAGIEAGRILRSEDGGTSWTRVRRGTALDVHALAFHPAVGGRAYEGAGGGTAVSDDGGRTWRRTNEGLKPRYVMTIAVDPADPDLWYAAAAPFHKAHGSDSRAALFRRRGTEWTRLGGGLPAELAHLPHALACPEPGHVWAGLRDGSLWRSEDEGDMWTRLPLQLDGLRALLVLREAD